MSGRFERELAYTLQDSGKREQFDSGMVRDTAEGKLRPDLAKDGPMFLRWVRQLTQGAQKYSPRNWMQAVGQAEYERALESVDRHYTTWFMWVRYGLNIENPEQPTNEPLAEDHAAAVFFNINLVEYIRERQQHPQTC